MVMFNILLIHATCNFDFVVIVCLYRNGQLFEYNNFKIISHCFHINSAFVLSYYYTNQNMFDTYFYQYNSRPYN
jgi:vancomycin permeability regulator SanA